MFGVGVSWGYGIGVQAFHRWVYGKHGALGKFSYITKLSRSRYHQRSNLSYVAVLPPRAQTAGRNIVTVLGAIAADTRSKSVSIDMSPAYTFICLRPCFQTIT